ncbi:MULTISPECIES: Imm70 family immunity protein [Myxococcus]|uniref:Imm70 family immunity protein n=1 Tax=Myxococcus TaxID=32 RepID=UPI001141E3CE|nr:MULTISPECIES: Imm70 family immunity protein [Myxococcus]MCK8500174.1 immunity 70 family protein [Myxococcus fulvus]
MGLYLCVFEDEEELEGVEVGSYADFGELRDYVTRELEGGMQGSRFPTLILHSDCDGEWSAAECQTLRDELTTIATELSARPVVAFNSEWQRNVAKSIGLVPKNAFESFIDVDGEFLLERLRWLADFAYRQQLPILFQ